MKPASDFPFGPRRTGKPAAQRRAIVQELERRERLAIEGADFVLGKVQGDMAPDVAAFVRTVAIRAAYVALNRQLDGPEEPHAEIADPV